MSKQRSATAIRFPPELHERLRLAAEAHGLPINFMVNKAVVELLDNLVEPHELRLTRRSSNGQEDQS